MDCPFCCFLRDYIGQYVRIGVVCNCDTNDHIYRDGYIRRNSFSDNLIKLYDSPVNGDVIFTACCDNIFEIYIFDNVVPDATVDLKNIISIDSMVEQRLNLLQTVKGNLQKEETPHDEPQE